MVIKGSLEHAELLANLGAETFYSSHKDSAPARELKQYMEKVYNVSAIKSELDNPENIYHFIKHGDRIVGFSKMMLDVKHAEIGKEPLSKMDQIYLLESVHGLKLGAELLRYNIDYARARGQKGMWLVVWVGNMSAISFYKKFGFHIVKEDHFQLTDIHQSPCYIMLLEYEGKAY